MIITSLALLSIILFTHDLTVQQVYINPSLSETVSQEEGGVIGTHSTRVLEEGLKFNLGIVTLRDPFKHNKQCIEKIHSHVF